MRQPYRWALTLALASTSLLSACIVVPAGRHYGNGGPGPYGGNGGGEVVVNVPPPAPQYEVVGPPPVVGYIWIGGFWNWIGNRHVWVGGRWDAPRQGHAYVPHRWRQDGNRGWRSEPGRWERRN